MQFYLGNDSELQDREVSFVLSSYIWNKLKDKVNSAELIIDIGCGNGTLLYNIRNNSNGVVIGLELDKKRCKASHMFSRSEVICADALTPSTIQTHPQQKT